MKLQVPLSIPVTLVISSPIEQVLPKSRMGVPPPTAPLYLNCTELWLASSARAWNATPSGPLLHVMTLFFEMNAALMCPRPGSPVLKSVGVVSTMTSASVCLIISAVVLPSPRVRTEPRRLFDLIIFLTSRPRSSVTEPVLSTMATTLGTSP